MQTKKVSWVRQSDLVILASDGVSHTSDARISAVVDDESSDWQLHIKEGQTKDSGVYECQVNTELKINWHVTLHVEGQSLNFSIGRNTYYKLFVAYDFLQLSEIYYLENWH